MTLELSMRSTKLPSGKTKEDTGVPVCFGCVRTAKDVGRLAASRRRSQGMSQADVAGLGMTGARFVGELERGKGTLQFDKVLHILDLLGLDVVIVERGALALPSSNFVARPTGGVGIPGGGAS